MHSTQPHIHSLWLQTIVVITLHPLHSWHHTPYIGHHTHAIQTLYLPSNPLYLTLHPLYLCHQKQGINYTTKTLCMISHRLYVWHHIQYACYQNYSLWHHTPLCITLHPVYSWQHIQYICDHHTALMTKQRLYLTSHRPYLTSQPLYLCHHTDGTHICIDVPLYRWHHNKCVSHHTRHMCDIIHIRNHITFTVYDINVHVLWNHKHPIHAITSPLYDITSTL